LRIHSRRAPDRPMSTPRRLMDGTVFILEKHYGTLKRSRKLLSEYLAVAGVGAARLGLHADARRFLFRSFMVNPIGIKQLLRFFFCLHPAIADLVWRSNRYRKEQSK
jgi:hypothetical protein